MRQSVIEANPPQLYLPGTSGGQDACEAEIADLAAVVTSWFILRAKARHEKKLAFGLMKQGIAYYLPLSKGRKSGHLRVLPVIPGVIFAGLRPGQAMASHRQCPHLFGASVVHEDWLLVRDLVALKTEVDAGRIKTSADLVKGNTYRVTEGPYKNYEGELVDKDHKDKWGWLLSLLGPIQVDAEALELVA